MATQRPRFDLAQLIGVIRRRWPVLVIPVVLLPAATFALQSRHPTRYSATAALLFRFPASSDPADDISSTSGVVDSSRAGNTRLQLLSLKGIAQEAAAHVRAQGLGAKVSAAISVGNVRGSDVAAVRATSGDPKT